MSEHESIPGSRLGRLARLAGAGLRTGAGLLLERDATDSALKAARVLGHLRGLATKVGQMAGYVDGVIPEQHREAFETAMKGLRAAAPTSSPAEVRRMLEEDLGAPIDQLFAEWDDQPIASASIGQVHRARLHDGLEVAVKVQHPGIAKALESDLANAGVVESMASMLGMKRFDTKAMLQVLRERFREELDYALEARRLAHFGQVHAGDPTIVIPRLIADRSSPRVLTAEFVRGRTFEQACEASEAERISFAQTMWRFVFKANTVGGMFNADPHPGNYVFLDDGRVAFLDFGCVQQIEGRRLPQSREVHRAALARDADAFHKAAMALVDAKPGPLGDAAASYLRRTFAPVWESPYRITREYAASLLDEMKGMAKMATKTRPEDFFTMPPEALFLNRLHFGFYSVLARFDVEVDYHAVEAGYWHEVPHDTAA